jgi:predicted nucleic acid-binding protein
MKMSIYLDTSVLIPTLVREAASDAVRAYLAANGERLISDLAAVEVASVLSRFVRTSLLTPSEAGVRLADFDVWRAATSASAEIHAADVRLADAYVRRFDLMLRGPDALHLAIANRLQAKLVTLGNWSERPKTSGLPSRYPRQHR